MNYRSILSSIAAVGIVTMLAFLAEPVCAQVPGSIISVGAMGGLQSSSRSDMSSADYYSVRGSFTNLFAELRHTDWGNATTGIHENGLLAGADISLFHIMFSGAVGIGSCNYQAAPILAGTPAPSQVSYNSLIYDIQAQYQFDLVAGLITAGIGVNYIVESNSVAPISGVGGVGSLSVGL